MASVRCCKYECMRSSGIAYCGLPIDSLFTYLLPTCTFEATDDCGIECGSGWGRWQ